LLAAFAAKRLSRLHRIATSIAEHDLFPAPVRKRIFIVKDHSPHNVRQQMVRE